MKLEIENKISEIKYILSLLKDHANFDDSKKRLENLEIASQAPDIWDDRIKAVSYTHLTLPTRYRV